MVEKVKQTDVYIKPDIAKYSVIDFGFLNEIINTGEIAARENYVALKELAIKQKKSNLPARVPVVCKDTLQLEELIIKGSEKLF